jgi:hypothetical protein
MEAHCRKETLRGTGAIASWQHASGFSAEAPKAKMLEILNVILRFHRRGRPAFDILRFKMISLVNARLCRGTQRV